MDHIYNDDDDDVSVGGGGGDDGDDDANQLVDNWSGWVWNKEVAKKLLWE